MIFIVVGRYSEVIEIKMRAFIALGEESNRSFLFSFLESFLQKIPFHTELNIQGNIFKNHTHTHTQKEIKQSEAYFFTYLNNQDK